MAWFLASNPDFDGSILVVERDPTYAFAATSHTNSCMREQFSAPINVQISQFGAAYVRNFRRFMNDDERIPTLAFHSFGYLYLAGSESAAQVLRECQQIQATCGAGTRFMTPDEIVREYPFYNLTKASSAAITTRSTKAISMATRCSNGGGAARVNRAPNTSPMKSSR